MSAAKTAPAAPDGKIGIQSFLWLALQLALVFLVMERFQIQAGFGFLELLPLIFVGFLVNAWLPIGLRPAWFALLSVASVFVVVPAPHSFKLAAMAFGLIGICHLPVAFRVRVALLLGAALGLARIRMGFYDLGDGRIMETRLIPLLGAMFMYRIAVYMYDLRNEKKPASAWERISYFFMLPNVSFMLFPVVDYTTYRRSYYKGDPREIYQHGATWIYRGVTHLIAYRVIYQYIIPAPESVDGVGSIVLYMLTTYLLYLRVSGQFHIIVGLLCLFGFNLPATHRLYYLATSFNDFWRRINIYWKDYMLKLFFYPTYMRLREKSMTTRLVISTIVVFVGTWLLHPYQQFWIRGSFPLTLKDGIFWSVLGVLVIVNSLQEAKTGSRRKNAQGWNLRGAYGVSLKTLGTFLFICVIWSFWSSDTIGEWLHMVATARSSPLSSWGLLLAGLLGVLHLGVLLNNIYAKDTALGRLHARLTPKDHKWPTLVGCSFLLLVSLPVGDLGLPDSTQDLVTSLREDRLNAHDQKRERRGYYEALNDSTSFTSALSGRKTAPKGPEWVSIRQADVARMTEDLLEYELKASYVGTWKDAEFLTNRWGMRDRDYAKAKPEGIFRIALVGASMEVAAGVLGSETYENQLEDRLNAELGGGVQPGFEVLNFAVGGYSMVQKALVVRDRIAEFEPDLVLVTIHSTEERRLFNHLAKVIVQGRMMRPFLAPALEAAGLDPAMSEAEVREHLIPVGDQILESSILEIRSAAEVAGIPLVMAFMPLSDDSNLEAEALVGLGKMVDDAGVERIAVRGAFDGYEEIDLLLAPDWDRLHLNVLGNRLLADALYDELVKHLGLKKN